MPEKEICQDIQYDVYTNSIIELTVPDKGNNPKNIYYQWKQVKSNSLILSSCQFPFGKRANQYICSPLDYGSVLNVTIRDGVNGKIFDKMDYGPIKIQPQLKKGAQYFKETYQIKVFFNNSFNKKSTLRVKGTYKFSGVEINIDSTHKLQIPLNKELKNEIGKCLLKVYHDEPYCLGIYVPHQYQKLRPIMKKMKMWQDIDGDYLIIQLSNRISRDTLIFQLLRITGTIIPQLQQFFKTFLFKRDKKTQLQQQQISANKQLSKQDPRKKKQSRQKLKFQQDKLMQDIYDILYTPSFDIGAEDGKNIFKKAQSDNKNFSNLLDSQILESFGSFTQQEMTKRQVQTPSTQEQKFKKKFGSIIIQQPMCGQKLIQLCKNKNYALSQSNSLSNSNKYEKYERLNRDYESLLRQNQKLRKDNMRLKSEKDISSTQTSSNLKKIKELVTFIANRIQHIQSVNVSSPQRRNVKRLPKHSQDTYDLSTLVSQKTLKKNFNEISLTTKFIPRKASQNKNQFKLNKGNLNFGYKSPRNTHGNYTINHLLMRPKSPITNSLNYFKYNQQV